MGMLLLWRLDFSTVYYYYLMKYLMSSKIEFATDGSEIK